MSAAREDRGIRAGVRRLFRLPPRTRAMADADADSELAAFLDARVEHLIARGMTPADARTEALRRLGAPLDDVRASLHRSAERREEHRRLRDWTEAVLGDVRFAVRQFVRAPGFTAAAVLTLALGVGVNAAVFSLVSARLLRPLPFEDAERLVVLHQTHSERRPDAPPFRWWSYSQAVALEPRLTTLSHLAAYYASDVNVSAERAEPARARMEMVSAAYFPMLGVRPALGRYFLPQEDSAPGRHPVTVLGHRLWQRHFAADPTIIGRAITLNGVSVSVVGVAPPKFRGLTGEADLWIPHAMGALVHSPTYLTSDQQTHGLVGRLRPGVPLERAQAEIATQGARVAQAVREAGGADDMWDGRGTWGAGLLPLEEARHNPAAVRAQLVLAGMAGFVLLIALVNLSVLLLARAVARARETAVRAALGAGRRRLIRQGLVEGGLLGLLAGALGIVLAIWSIQGVVAFAPQDWGQPRLSVAGLGAFAEPTIDWRVTGFATVVALVAGLLAGLLPMLRTTRGDLAGSLRAGARGSSVGMGSLRRPTVLSVAATLQVACALVLLVGAGLLMEGLRRLNSVDAGFEEDGVVTFRISPPQGTYGGDAAGPLIERVLERVNATPGVRSASVNLCVPFSGCSSTVVSFPERPEPTQPRRVGWHYAGPDYFRTLGIPLLRGRAITEDDRAGRPRVAVVNETAARQFWPGEDPIGKRVWFGGNSGFASPDSLTTIVGVVADALYAPPGTEIRPDFYISYLQYTLPTTTVFVRATGSPRALVPALRGAVADVDPNLAIHDVRTLPELAAASLATERFSTALLAVFAGLGLLLASLGVHGVMAYSVVQRRREIGIRLALGATPREVLHFVIRQGLALAVVGLAIGGAVSLAVARLLPALVAGIGSADPVVLVAVAALLLTVVLLACALPARAATRVNPVETIAAN